MIPSRWSRFGLLVVLTAALGFLFAVAISAQRTARMHAALGLGVEAEKPGSPTWTDGLDDVASDDGNDGDDELTPPGTPPDPAVVPNGDGDRRDPLRVAEREPDSPFLTLEEDPP